MNVNQETNGSGPSQFRVATGWLAFIFGALALSVEVFLHRSRTFGERYIGLQAGAVLLIVPVYSLFWNGYDLVPLLRFLELFLLMSFLARLGVSFRRRRNGHHVHSRYTGCPRLLRIMPWASELTLKRLVEPMVVFFTGVFTLSLNQPLGGYLMVASAGLLASVHLNVNYERVRALDMYDASLEQRQIAERFRDMRAGKAR